MAADFFFQHEISITNSFYRRMMHEEDERPPNEKPHAYDFSMTYNGCDFCCNSCSPQMPIQRMESEISWFHLPKILFSSLQLKLIGTAQR